MTPRRLTKEDKAHMRENQGSYSLDNQMVLDLVETLELGIKEARHDAENGDPNYRGQG